MILKQFYNEKKEALRNKLFNNFGANSKVLLYTDTVFDDAITAPAIMFKYDNVHWESSSERTYKADVNFSVHIVMPKGGINDDTLENVFDLAGVVDSVMLTGSRNKSPAFIDTHSTFKVYEKQWLNSQTAFWKKNEFFIWEIGYKTTLVENSLKKKYNLLRNGTLEKDIAALGYNLETDFLGNLSNSIKGTLDVNGKSFSLLHNETNTNGAIVEDNSDSINVNTIDIRENDASTIDHRD